MKILKGLLGLIIVFVLCATAFAWYQSSIAEKERQAELALENKILNREFRPIIENYIGAYNRCDIDEASTYISQEQLSFDADVTRLFEMRLGALERFCKKLSVTIKTIRTLRMHNDDAASIRIALNLTVNESGEMVDPGTDYNKWSFKKEEGTWKIRSDSFEKLLTKYHSVLEQPSHNN